MGMTNHKMRNISARARRRRLGIRAIGAVAGAYQEHNSSLSTGVRGTHQGSNIATRPNTAAGTQVKPGYTGPTDYSGPAKLPDGGYHFGASPGEGQFIQ
jgi:hypothetical protein